MPMRREQVAAALAYKQAEEERRATFPMKSYDVPPQDVIVRKVR